MKTPNFDAAKVELIVMLQEMGLTQEQIDKIMLKVWRASRAAITDVSGAVSVLMADIARKM